MMRTMIKSRKGIRWAFSNESSIDYYLKIRLLTVKLTYKAEHTRTAEQALTAEQTYSTEQTCKA